MEPHIILFVSTCPLSNYGAKLIIGFDDPDLDRYTVQDWASLTLMIYNSLVPLVHICKRNKKAFIFLTILVHFYKNQIMFKSTTQLASEASSAAAL